MWIVASSVPSPRAPFADSSLPRNQFGTMAQLDRRWQATTVEKCGGGDGFRAGSGCLNNNSASISGASAGVRPPRGAEENRSRRKIEVGLIRGAVVKARMRSSPVVKVEISTNRASRLTDGFVGSQIDLLVFDAFPKPLDEHVVSPSSFAIHADGDAVVGEDTGKGRTGELRALVGVEDVRPAVTRESIFQRLDAEGRLHRDRQPPRQNTTCRPVEHHGEIDEAVRHRNVGDVHGPDLVWTRNLQATQQIRMDLVAGLGLGGARAAIERLYPHPPHQRLHMPAADLAPLQSQQASQHTRTGERILQVQPIELPHDLEVG